MFSHNGKISARQTMILIIIQMVNMALLILPRICSDYAGRNGYILPLTAIPVGIVYVWVLTGLTIKFPGKTIYEIIMQLLGGAVAKVIVFLFTAKLVVGMAIELRIFSELISQVMLSRTPIQVIILVMLLAAGYLSKSGIEAVVRMSEVLAYFIFIPLLLILLGVSFKVDYAAVLPVLQTDLKDVWLGTGIVSLWFMPLELFLILGGLMKEPQRAFKAGSLAVIAIGVLEGILVLFTICKIGVGETVQQIWPLVTLMRSIGSQGAVVEKQEILMLIIWIFTAFMYVSTQLCLASIMMSRSLRYKRENLFVLPLSVIAFFIAAWPSSLNRMYDVYVKFKYVFGIWFLFVIPLILLIISKFRRQADEE